MLTESYSPVESVVGIQPSLTVMPVLPPMYLSNLTLNPKSVIGGSGGASTGTCTLSASSLNAITVNLKSNTTGISVPTTIQVPAGATSANFHISTSSVANPILATISASSNGWTQAALLSVLPVGYSFTVQSFGVGSGNGCTLLSWIDLADGSVQGYHIYRMNNGTAVRLTAVPQHAPLYADTGLTNGTTYKYQVSVVNNLGQEVSFSNLVSATPSGTIPSLSWFNPPSTATDSVYLSASISSGKAIGTFLMLDGNISNGAGDGNANNGDNNRILTDLDTTNLSNGVHVIQLVGYIGNDICASLPIQIQVINDFSNFVCDEMFEQPLGEITNITSVLPSGTTHWTAQILDNNNIVVRSWQASTSIAKLAWDGTDRTGVVVVEDDYSVQLTAVDSQGGQKIKKKHVDLIKGSPNALVLYEEASSNHNDDIALINTIKAQLKRMQLTNPGFTFKVLPLIATAPKVDRLKIRKWMGSTVTDFYLFGHGSAGGQGLPPVAYYGGAMFWGGSFPVTSQIYQDSLKAPELHLIVPIITAGRQYNFAMIDACGGAGDDGNGNPANPADQSWANAFNIGSNINFASAFFGWDGKADTNTFPDGTSSNWLMWRQQFWIALAIDMDVYRAAQYATSNTTSRVWEINPWDGPSNYANYRAQLFGDITTTLP